MKLMSSYFLIQERDFDRTTIMPICLPDPDFQAG